MAPVCNNHRVWEFGIDLHEISAAAGENVRLGLRLVSQNPSFTYEIPSNFILDFSDLIEVSLASPPSAIAIDPLAFMSFDEAPERDAIEVTQAIQDRANSMPLVAGKTTAARMYVQASGLLPFSSHAAIAYLYGTRDGNDLPGSPLSQLFGAPTTIDRERLGDTANFLLPDSWVTGTIEFQGQVYTMFGEWQDTSTSFSLTFTPKDIPVYWVVPINHGTEEEPILPTEEEIADLQSYLMAVYPVPDVTFVRKDWRVIDPIPPRFTPEGGDLALNDILMSLREYYYRVEHARWLSVCWTPPCPPRDPLPDQIFGVRPSGEGILGKADVVQTGGCGHVAAGPRSRVFEVGPAWSDSTMAHEIDHNLDLGEPQTWGLHVGDPDFPDNPDWGCGADGGPDPDWPCPDLPCTDEIGEVGFDTRPPWVDSLEWIPSEDACYSEDLPPFEDRRFTVIPDEWPDFVSYCRQRMTVTMSSCMPGAPPQQPLVLVRPFRWISPYRWQHLFDAFPAPRTASLTSRISQEQVQTVYYLSGHVDKDGTGSLDPIFVQPGIPTEDIRPGDYIIEVQDASGKPLLTTSFRVSFTDIEGNEFETVHFHYQLPEQSGTSKILLKKGDQVLDEIMVSGNPPTVMVLAPNGGEQWSGRQTIQWRAEDEDGDPLSFTILYSPDKGDSWFPVAWGVQGQSYEVDTAILPGGDAARVRVIATDGFNTRQDDTDGTFWVQGKPPAAYIIQPEADTRFSPGESIQFEGEASDMEDGLLPDESFIWSYDSTFFGVGRRANARFPAGTYEVTLTVVDSDGNTGQTAVVIFVGHQVYLPIVLKSYP